VLANVTMHDYLGVMNSVGTAELKAHLSEHLQAVRRGETLIVLDRREPIARIVPMGPSGPSGVELTIRPARGSLRDMPVPGPTRSTVDVLEQLQQERGERL
jgi:antitoxin (DNA-binding transcriptional repressor) of toxin-antitoxin stability system